MSNPINLTNGETSYQVTNATKATKTTKATCNLPHKTLLIPLSIDAIIDNRLCQKAEFNNR